MEKVKRVTVKDIAKELGISLSTVNKALTGKNGISESRRFEIIDTANRLGYKVNKVAQSLARNEMRIGIIMPNDWPQFYKFMEKGLNVELERLADFNMKGIFKYFSHKQNLAESIQLSLSELMQQNINAIILCPVYHNYENILKQIQEKNIPLVLLGSDITAYGKRLTCVRVNAELSGKMAAEIIRLFLPSDKVAAMFIGNKDIEVHKEKVNGFFEEANNRTPITIAGVFETQDDTELAYVLTKKLLLERQDIGAIYVATGNSSAVCKCIEDNGLIGKVRVVATDIFKEQIEYMNKGIVVATIHQNADLQGKLALRTLYSYLSEGTIPQENTLVTPQIALRSNVEQVLQNL
ncbi:MAG: LacI family DNA-binding transcriptional regulator [Nitrospiraceae bacterium]|nr:MAG: LacI family DNA-binding transcriptional regulator [Nitrospiraceae bacterium]